MSIDPAVAVAMKETGLISQQYKHEPSW